MAAEVGERVDIFETTKGRSALMRDPGDYGRTSIPVLKREQDY